MCLHRTTDCSEMKNSGRCNSEAECDKGELGAVMCSCKAHASRHTLGPEIPPEARMDSYGVEKALAGAEDSKDKKRTGESSRPIWIDSAKDGSNGPSCS